MDNIVCIEQGSNFYFVVTVSLDFSIALFNCSVVFGAVPNGLIAADNIAVFIIFCGSISVDRIAVNGDLINFIAVFEVDINFAVSI